VNRTALIAHVTPYDDLTKQRQQSFVANFMDHGSTYFRAVAQSLEALERVVVRQTFLMSYMDTFLLLAILNACCIPLVLTTIKKRAVLKPGKAEVPDSH